MKKHTIYTGSDAEVQLLHAHVNGGAVDDAARKISNSRTNPRLGRLQGRSALPGGEQRSTRTRLLRLI
eukprot:4334395-Pyramimonas_sp.AAC.1